MNEWRMFVGCEWKNTIFSTKATGFSPGASWKKVVFYFCAMLCKA